MFEIHAEIRYQRLGQIGVGEGMNSFVFRANDPYLNRVIAVKEVEKSRFGNNFDTYCGEARAMFATASPNIVGLLYICETPSTASHSRCRISLMARWLRGLQTIPLG